MLKLKSWEPVEYLLGEAPIRFEVKRLAFLEQRTFATTMQRVRRDKVVKFTLMAQAEQAERQRFLLARTNAALTAAGHEAMPEGDDLGKAFDAAEKRAAEVGVTVPPLTSAELETLLRQDEGRIEQQQAALDEFFGSIDPDWLAKVFRDYVRNVSNLEIDGEAVTTGEALLGYADQGLVLFVLSTIDGFSRMSDSAGKASPSRPTSPSAEESGKDGGSVVRPVASEDGTSVATVPATPPAEPLSSDLVAVSTGSLP